MAEEKKSFLFYVDWGDTFEELSNEDAGELIKHMCSYVKDENPVTDNALVKAVFIQIKNHLKRDLKKWEEKKEGQSQAGIEGNLKRWHLDLYEDYKRGVYTLNDALSVAKGREPSPPDPTQSDPIAEIAVNVTDTVNGTDINNNTPTKVDGFVWGNLLQTINKVYGREFRVINKTVRAKYNARLKEGYTKKDVQNAILNCKKNKFHIETNYEHCTPEYFSRSKTLDLHSKISEPTKSINPHSFNPVN